MALKHSAAAIAPSLIRPRTKNITVAITARCNLRCKGCLYERGFMPGKQLDLDVVRTMLDDAAAGGVKTIRFYGGEPLLHQGLSAMIRHAREVGLDPYVTTNAMLLAHRADELVEAGLRFVTIGFYGTGDEYDVYTGRPGAYDKFERAVASVRARFGDKLRLRLNWLLRRDTCTVAHVDEAVAFADAHGTPLQIDLIHYSLPYFTEGENRELQFTADDRPRIAPVVARLLEHREARPELRSIPDWLVLGPDMDVPCDKYEMLWVGADGSVQLCYVQFPMGNLHDTRLKDLLFSPTHQAAARGAFCLDCQNGHCGYDSRIQKHAPSRRRYGKPTLAPR